MFKRLFWLIVGAGFGFGVAFWLMRVVRDVVDRYRPERVSGDIGDAIRAFGADLRAAVAEGREAMREREESLRAELEQRPTVREPGGSSPAATAEGVAQHAQ